MEAAARGVVEKVEKCDSQLEPRVRVRMGWSCESGM